MPVSFREIVFTMIQELHSQTSQFIIKIENGIRSKGRSAFPSSLKSNFQCFIFIPHSVKFPFFKQAACRPEPPPIL